MSFEPKLVVKDLDIFWLKSMCYFADLMIDVIHIYEDQDHELSKHLVNKWVKEFQDLKGVRDKLAVKNDVSLAREDLEILYKCFNFFLEVKRHVKDFHEWHYGHFEELALERIYSKLTIFFNMKNPHFKLHNKPS